MNIFLWVFQILLALLCISGGVFKIFKFADLQKGVASMRALPRGLWAFVGAFEVVCGLGLIIPGAINVLPVMTPMAAAAMAGESVLISVLYIYHRDFSPMIYTVVMGVIAAFIAYGRFVLKPL